jgi:hypothetical protein
MKLQETSIGRVQYLFIAYPASITLVLKNPDIILVDSTYKTNKFEMPLLHMLGITSSGKSFSIGFTFLPSKTATNYTWAVQQFKALRIRPGVVVMDGDNAIRIASETVFEDIPTMLCTWHVNQCVLANCKSILRDK